MKLMCRELAYNCALKIVRRKYTDFNGMSFMYRGFRCGSALYLAGVAEALTLVAALLYVKRP